MGRGRLSGTLSLAVSLSLLAVIVVLVARGTDRQRPITPNASRAAAEAASAAEPSPARADTAEPIAIRLPPPPPPAPTQAASPTAAPPRPASDAARRPPPKETAPVVSVATEPAPQPIVADAALRRTGRAMLRLVEHGRGPVIRIAWPATPRDRDRLHRRLTRCYGVRTAVLGPNAGLYRDAGATGVRWDIDLDRFSGFIREPAGQPITAEARQAAAIAARHGLSDWRLVRVFRRDVDAVLLGGLHRLAGKAYGTARTITASYAMRAGRLLLRAVRVDGTPVPGTVDFTGAARRGCGARAMG